MVNLDCCCLGEAHKEKNRECEQSRLLLSACYILHQDVRQTTKSIQPESESQWGSTQMSCTLC